MGNWKYTCDIKDLLADENPNVHRIAQIIATRLKQLLGPVRYDPRLNHIIGDFEGLVRVTADDVDAFDDMLENLYDWADTHRVWLGV